MTPPTPWDGEEYQARFDALAASGTDVHGEVRFVLALSPASVLDAGCGTGRVAIELDRCGLRGVTGDVVGVDIDPSMLATARSRAPTIRFDEADLSAPGFDLGRRFGLVVMAGNVPLFTPPGSQRGLVAGCARHLEPGGVLVAGFSLGRGYGLEPYDDDCAASGLVLVERWAGWDREELDDAPGYAVSVHRLRA